jgi:4-hydroxy-2-oxoheptanedioate aldolase
MVVQPAGVALFNLRIHLLWRLPVRPNQLKRRLQAGRVVVGVMISEVRSPNIVVMMAEAGFEFIVIDTEHSSIDLGVVGDIILAGRGTDCTVMVRPPAKERILMSRPLDVGAEGLLVPLIDTREEAEAVIAATKYHPLGRRGLASRRAFSNYSTRPITDIVAEANAETLIAVQVETARAVANVEEIVSVPGIDVAFVGPNDLSQSMGVPGQYDHPEVEAAINRVIVTCQRSGVAPGIYAGNTDFARRWIDAGMRFIIYLSDVNLLVDGGAAALKRLGVARP